MSVWRARGVLSVQRRPRRRELLPSCRHHLQVLRHPAETHTSASDKLQGRWDLSTRAASPRAVSEILSWCDALKEKQICIPCRAPDRVPCSEHVRNPRATLSQGFSSTPRPVLLLDPPSSLTSHLAPPPPLHAFLETTGPVAAAPVNPARDFT